MRRLLATLAGAWLAAAPLGAAAAPSPSTATTAPAPRSWLARMIDDARQQAQPSPASLTPAQRRQVQEILSRLLRLPADLVATWLPDGAAQRDDTVAGRTR